MASNDPAYPPPQAPSPYTNASPPPPYMPPTGGAAMAAPPGAAPCPPKGSVAPYPAAPYPPYTGSPGHMMQMPQQQPGVGRCKIPSLKG